MDFTERLRSSKALIPTIAVMAVTVAALATTLAVTRSNANGSGMPVVTAPARPEVVAVPPLAPQAPVQPAPVVYQPPVRVAQAPAAPAAPAAPVCHTCGVVESVVPVQRQGQPKGIAGTQVTPGMAIGGVVGGLLGNQIGHGNGRAATTVLGAAGGAYAGHAIEKNTTKYTVYQVRVRMNDGTVRTVEQRNAIAQGSHVVLEHGALRPVRAKG
ncbi:MAG: glycine zipper 2TM domain-containing protein [Burkholderiales bacterium]|nr:glycine zipper 2TM domain-containing protein [Burkholderiales bacterium]